MITTKQSHLGLAGDQVAGAMARRGALPFRVYDSTETAKRQASVFDKALSHRLDCVLTLADTETSPWWCWVLRVYRRCLERGIP